MAAAADDPARVHDCSRQGRAWRYRRGVHLGGGTGLGRDFDCSMVLPFYGVSVRDLVGEQILQLFELVTCFLAECHLEFEATR